MFLDPPPSRQKTTHKTKPDGSREMSHEIEHDTTVKALRASRTKKKPSREAMSGDGRMERPAPAYAGDPSEPGLPFSGSAPPDYNPSFPNNRWQAPTQDDADPMRMISNIQTIEDADRIIRAYRANRML